MTPQTNDLIQKLQTAGWKVVISAGPQSLPAHIIARYPWMPALYRDFAVSTSSAVAPEDKSWVLTAADFQGTSESAFTWNEWEQLSLQAAQDDTAWQQRIQQFWDEH